jgi:hypothetical protein
VDCGCLHRYAEKGHSIRGRFLVPGEVHELSIRCSTFRVGRDVEPSGCNRSLEGAKSYRLAVVVTKWQKTLRNVARELNITHALDRCRILAVQDKISLGQIFVIIATKLARVVGYEEVFGNFDVTDSDLDDGRRSPG